MACICARNSLPERFAGSPVQVSSKPRTANFIFVSFRILANERITPLYLSSKLPAQPIQKRISASSPLATTSESIGISKPSAHNILSLGENFHGAPLFSILLIIPVSSAGAFDSSMNKLRRKSMMMLSGSISTGHSSTQALQLVHAHNSSSVI